MEPPSSSASRATRYDVAIIGAGPVGLALAIALARQGLHTLVVDRRPPLDHDAHVRPQLLVARAGDLAHLRLLGLELDDPCLVSWLASRCEIDLASGRSIRGDVSSSRPALAVPAELGELTAQPPLALIPIGRLQQTLLARARALAVDVRYGCEVVRLRRHARAVSLRCADGGDAQATLAIIVTGAARPLLATIVRGALVSGLPAQHLVGAVFADPGDRGERAHWVRAEVPVPGLAEPARCTLLQTSADAGAGTALLVETRVPGQPTDAECRRGFAAAARALGLAGAPYRVAPAAFTTAATAVPRRCVVGDGRAPVLIAGDAAQTGHVFTGQTCFVNLALALQLAAQLSGARAALQAGDAHAAAIGRALAAYERRSARGAELLARGSRRHYRAHAAGGWALAGVARA